MEVTTVHPSSVSRLKSRGATMLEEWEASPCSLLVDMMRVYLVVLIIKYLREKPPNLQTLLDGFQIQFFVSWIIFGIMTIISEGVLVLNTLGIENKTITCITAWICYSSVLFISVSMATSCVARAILIFWPSIVESIRDKKIWVING